MVNEEIAPEDFRIISLRIRRLQNYTTAEWSRKRNLDETL